MNFLYRFWKNIQIFSSMKIRPVETELFHVNKRTDGRRGRQRDSQSDRKKDRQTGRQVWRSY